MSEKFKKSYSMKTTILVVFLTLIVITVVLVSFLIFSNWLSSSGEITRMIAEQTNSVALTQIEDLINHAFHNNDINQKWIKNRIVHLDQEDERDKFFASVLLSNGPEIYSFNYGTENGELYGARRNEKDEIEIIRNNAQTGGHIRFYSIQPDLSAGELALETDTIDPRTRQWYKVAKEKGEPVFSPVYWHYILPEMVISAAWPVYDDNGSLMGVLGTHIALSDINKALQTIIREENGYALILEKETGELIANSFGQNSFTFLQDGAVQRKRIEDIGNPWLIQAYHHYRNTGESDFIQKITGDRLYIDIQEYSENGIHWIAMAAIPERLLNGDIIQSFHNAGLFALFMLALCVFMSFMVIRQLLKPVGVLVSTAQKIADGDLSQRVHIARNDEMGMISDSFNRIADTLSNLINNLENTVTQRTAEVYYLSEHDALTGLLNRHSLDEKLKEVDTESNLPISVIFADINVLKLTNDIFGHTAGDNLIKTAAQVLRQACREHDIIARVGGDEFVVILLQTTASAAEKIINRVQTSISKELVEAIKCSMALGTDTKTRMSQDLNEIITNAEESMYREKTLNRKANHSETVKVIISTLHENNPDERRHSIKVSEMCEGIARELGLPETEVNKVKRAGYVHDVGKVVLKKELIESKQPLTDAQINEIQQHTANSYRILNLFDDTLDIADAVYSHHEKWDGSGFPQGLKANEIPLFSRIISLAEAYDRRMNGFRADNSDKKEAVIQYIRENSGKRFDPELAELFIQYLLKQ
ncbi:MAG: diguanylate cyclase [Thermoclostridium sp.]|nr:diguanylate cyclase [Thermoclostridium sp.]